MLQLSKSLYRHQTDDQLIPVGINVPNLNYWPKKLYTQQEVDALLESKIQNIPSQELEIENESRTAAKHKRLDNRTVASLVKKSNRILVSISSHAFPFDLFPDSINVEEGRVTIIIRHFLSSEVHSIDLKDITNIFINTTFFFPN